MLLFLCLCVLLVFVAACGQNEEAAEPEPDVEETIVEPEPEPEPEPLPELPAFTLPLTGLGSDLETKARPIVVFVENSPMARPQSGLDQADIVFEVLAEGNITRFIAVYQSEQPEVIGPVRSARPYMVELGYGLDGIIVHAGWSQAAKNILVERRIHHFDAVYGDHMYYWRSSERYAPHNLYTSIEQILQGADDRGYRTDEWKNPELVYDDLMDVVTASAPLFEGEAAGQVDIGFINTYAVSYEYDDEAGTYLRSMVGEPHLDKETEEQLTVENLMVCVAPHRIVDDVGRRDIQVTGQGPGMIFRDGASQQVECQFEDGIYRPYADGELIALKPGKTWIHIISDLGRVSYGPRMTEEVQDEEAGQAEELEAGSTL